MSTRFTINGKPVTSRRARHAAALGDPRRDRHDRHQVRLRRWRCAAPAPCISTAQPVRSCQTPLSAVAGSKVTTIESLSRNNTHPLQAAWIAHDVPQCGYCQSGQLMSAAALLATQQEPERRRHRRGHERQHLPLRHLSAASSAAIKAAAAEMRKA